MLKILYIWPLSNEGAPAGSLAAETYMNRLSVLCTELR
jgi:hypothetical protein